MLRCSALFLLLLSFAFAKAQSVPPDSVHALNEVVVKAYLYDRPLNEVPAAVGIVGAKDLERFNNVSFLPAVNTVPGVRMEERSPGSYRFSIRGSSLRSPFGIRNVKFYWNGLPVTDGGGNTYLNLLDFNSISNAEIIKGPGGSLYGAGTGGVVLLNSAIIRRNQVQVSATAGSYGLQRYQVSAQESSQKVKASVNYAHLQSNGYRQQTKMRRDALNTDLLFDVSSKGSLAATIFYTDLDYQTPGALTLAEYKANPRQARQISIDQQATVYNKTLYGGVMYNYQWNDQWSTRAGGYGSMTHFINPTIRNYEVRKEYNWGGRTETQFETKKSAWQSKVTFGGEFQHFYSPLTDYDNAKGIRGNVQTDDRLYSTLLLLFAQAEIDLPSGFYLTAGGSGNFLDYKMNRVSVTPSVMQKRNFDPVFSPRVALLKKVNDNFSLYGNISKGFSPPSLAEVRPSTGSYNNTLNPEQGTSYEAGIRGNFLKRISFDVAAYELKLNQTIVIQREVDGADYYVNAGATSQKGVEARLSWDAIVQSSDVINYLKLWTSYTYNHYRFQNYVQSGTDFSGNKLTGVAPNIVVSGVDVTLFKSFYANVTTNYVDRIPLDNANDAFASSYFLLGSRVGYKHTLKKTLVEVFAGGDNLFNKTYSLGNDLNGAGGRFYNAAAGRNFYAGVKINLQ